MVTNNTFLALADDMGESWQGWCKNDPEPYSFTDTPQYEGLIHPRIKLPISQRLAYAGYDILYGEDNEEEDMMDKLVSGPFISGCTLDTENGNIIIEFNEKFLNGEKIQIFPFETWYDESIEVHDWSSM